MYKGSNIIVIPLTAIYKIHFQIVMPATERASPFICAKKMEIPGQAGEDILGMPRKIGVLHIASFEFAAVAKVRKHKPKQQVEHRLHGKGQQKGGRIVNVGSALFNG